MFIVNINLKKTKIFNISLLLPLSSYILITHMHNHFFFIYKTIHFFYFFNFNKKNFNVLHVILLYYSMIFLNAYAFRYQNNQNNDNIFPELLIFPNRFIFL